jgi:hypothetical protein
MYAERPRATVTRFLLSNRHNGLQCPVAFRAYVPDRYGTAERAKAFWQANGWY